MIGTHVSYTRMFCLIRGMAVYSNSNSMCVSIRLYWEGERRVISCTLTEVRTYACRMWSCTLYVRTHTLLMYVVQTHTHCSCTLYKHTHSAHVHCTYTHTHCSPMPSVNLIICLLVHICYFEGSKTITKTCLHT